MFTFSAVEIELSYLRAKEDFTKHKIQKAQSQKKSTKELKQRLEFTQKLIKQLQNRINATIE